MTRMKSFADNSQCKLTPSELRALQPAFHGSSNAKVSK
jgi:hypothetical protein